MARSITLWKIVIWIVASVVVGLGLRHLALQQAAQVAQRAEQIKQAAAISQTKQATIVSQQWQVCWQKVPGAKGFSNTQFKCMPTTVKRDNSSLLLVYRYDNNRQGTMEATSSDGASYDGTWRDAGGWGKFHFWFTSPTTALGWIDEKGEKPIPLSLTLQHKLGTISSTSGMKGLEVIAKPGQWSENVLFPDNYWFFIHPQGKISIRTSNGSQIDDEPDMEMKPLGHNISPGVFQFKSREDHDVKVTIVMRPKQ